MVLKSGISLSYAGFAGNLKIIWGSYYGNIQGDLVALLPLPHIEGALEEIRYALDVLKLNGVGMHSHRGGIYSGFDQKGKSAILRDNALDLFPHFNKKP